MRDSCYSLAASTDRAKIAVLLALVLFLLACGGGVVSTAPTIKTTSHSVDLSWGASPTGGVAYNVYRASTSGGPYAQLNSNLITATAYTDNSVGKGLTYYYVVRSVDPNNMAESANSNEATAVIPSQ